MKEISATVTCGQGSEIHNHDLDYRANLSHTHNRENAVIELIEYRDYREQINEKMEPYIDEYNERMQRRYKAAWDRYNNGEIKSKPKKADYKSLGYDYYNDHLHDTCRNPNTQKIEEIPMLRSMIIGIGDRNDRQNERITENQATEILKDTFNQMKRDFPSFLFLGATIHLDESGFYHMHVDYKPIYEKTSNCKGLRVGIGMDSALQAMGYKPEQSIINARDKIPICFNAMRNRIYYNLESAMNKQGFKMQYHASKSKEPAKDTTKNQRLEAWQATQDAVQSLQHNKNIASEMLEKDNLTNEEVKEALQAFHNIENALKAIEQSPRSRLDRDKRIVQFTILEQIKTFWERLKRFIIDLIRQKDFYEGQCKKYAQEAQNCVKIDKMEYDIQQARHIAEVENEKMKVQNLEQHLASKGYSAPTIDRIENGGEYSKSR